MDLSFFKNKTVLITGHTGFKGSWSCKLLTMLGANVIGYALNPPTNPALFDIANIADEMISIIGDIRDLDRLSRTIQKYQPEIVVHMAAQPIVREGYLNPVITYETNVMGTVNICEAIRHCTCVRSFVNITTDKVYSNDEYNGKLCECDKINGFDPYSNSKSCSELITSCYKKSFFQKNEIAASTCRSGNAIGGGDFAQNRIFPDCVRAMQAGKDIVVRNPSSTRPYQHVLESTTAYLLVAAKQYQNPNLADCYNIGPDESISNERLVELFCSAWGKEDSWVNINNTDSPYEADKLELDCTKIRNVLQWKPLWTTEEAVQKSVEWSKAYINGENTMVIMEKQIREYLSE
ncbi:MAG: CDP-glucose 4,6-dehydratase [Oscillospiraceae bacterium]